MSLQPIGFIALALLDWVALGGFVISFAVIFYVIAGYPLLLALLSRRASRSVHKEWMPRTVSVILPVHNGERWIRLKLESILALDYPRHLLQILVIDDGSTDGTSDIVSEFAGSHVELIRIPRGGKPAALNAGMRRARGELLFFTDVRQPLDRASLGHLSACFADASVGVASGELVILQSDKPEHADIGLYWRYEKWIRHRLSRVGSMIGATGCIYAIRRELAVPIPVHTLLDDVYLPLAAFSKGYRIVMDGSARAFDYPTALSSEFRRKLRTQAGVYQLAGAYPSLLWPTNRLWFHFVSYKLGRLALPYAAILLAICSFGLPPPWRGLAIAGEFGFGALAAGDVWIPAAWRIKRLSSICRTVVVLLAAALLAARVLFKGTADLWRETEVRSGGEQRLDAPEAHARSVE